jgi:hypothetical protein
MSNPAPTLHIDLLANCCHSLKRGYELWSHGQRDNDGWLLKEAIIWIHHGVELALKQLLVQTNEYLVFENVDKAVEELTKLRKSNNSAGALDLFEQDRGTISVGFRKLIERCAMMLNLSELN